MFDWVSRLFRRQPASSMGAERNSGAAGLLPAASPRTRADADHQEVPGWAEELIAQLEDAAPPPWAKELAESVQKLARAQGKLSLLFEQLERKLEGGLEDLRSTVEQRAKGPRARQEDAAAAGWIAVLDALDLLGEVKRQPLLPPGCAEGLEGVIARLDGALECAGIARQGEIGLPVDGRCFRIVGTEEVPEWPEGVVTRLVRHAATRGTELLREGEVLINRRAS